MIDLRVQDTLRKYASKHGVNVLLFAGEVSAQNCRAAELLLMNATGSGIPLRVVVDSLGGSAHDAFRLAKAAQLCDPDYEVLVARRAKSAATLFCLGAKQIRMTPTAELGPLDVQLLDSEREQFASGLDQVQAVSYVANSAVEVVDTLMPILLAKTGKRAGTLLPHVLDFAASLVKPMVDNIDVSTFAGTGRLMELAYTYAVELMSPHYEQEAAESAARRLVHAYPDHGFVIQSQHAKSVGLAVEDFTDPIGGLLNILLLSGLADGVGFFEPSNDDEPQHEEDEADAEQATDEQVEVETVKRSYDRESVVESGEHDSSAKSPDLLSEDEEASVSELGEGGAGHSKSNAK